MPTRTNGAAEYATGKVTCTDTAVLAVTTVIDSACACTIFSTAVANALIVSSPSIRRSVPSGYGRLRTGVFPGISYPPTHGPLAVSHVTVLGTVFHRVLAGTSFHRPVYGCGPIHDASSHVPGAVSHVTAGLMSSQRGAGAVRQ